MIYASDIDRTLIFSERFIKQFNISRDELNLIDECKTNSYISSKVADKLSHLTSEKKVRFIPVTTRGLEQFKRIQFSKYGIDIEYAIVCNGGIIIHNGEKLTEWEDYIHSKEDIQELKELSHRIDKISGMNRKSAIVDGRYIFTKSVNIPSIIADVKGELSALQKEIPHYKFSMYGSKVYAIPKYFGKDITLLWLKQYLGEDKIISSGDSSFDIPMLSISDIGVIPSHASIEKQDVENFNVKYINGGIDSAISTIDMAISIL